MTADQNNKSEVGLGLRVCGAILALIGLALLAGGAWLAFLRGPLYDTMRPVLT
jgi:glucose dehydrogenase